MRPLVNPFMPTPLGSAYYLPNPSTGKAVEFDDCEQKSRTMVDYKDRYWDMLRKPGISKLVMDDLPVQALRQISAAGQRPVRWYFAEKKPRISCAFNFISAATFETGLISKSGLSQEDDNERTALSVFHLVGAPATSFATIVINPSPSRAVALLA